MVFNVVTCLFEMRKYSNVEYTVFLVINILFSLILAYILFCRCTLLKAELLLLQFDSKDVTRFLTYPLFSNCRIIIIEKDMRSKEMESLKEPSPEQTFR